MLKVNQKYVIGVDGGGSKTVAVLANLEGKILARYQSGSSHPRNIGVKNAIKNLVQAIENVLDKIRDDKKIISTFLGLPAMEEEFKFKKNIIKKELFKNRKIQPIFEGKMIIDSDQLAGFRSGTDKKDGVVLIAGSGCAVHGWRGEIAEGSTFISHPRFARVKEIKVCGWGYLSEMGSSFWVGQKALQVIFKNLDGRGQETLMTKFIFQKFKVKNIGSLIEKIYSKNPTEVIPPLAILVDKASKKGDEVAKNITREAGKELALSAKTVIRKLNFQKFKFPLVLIGSMFKSKIVLDTVKKEVKKFAPRVEFIRPKTEPVIGAVKLALAEALPHLAPRPDSQDLAIEALNNGKN